MPHNVKAQLFWTQMTEVREQRTDNRNQINEFGIGTRRRPIGQDYGSASMRKAEYRYQPCTVSLVPCT